MTTWALDDNGDIAISQRGPILIKNNLETMQNVKTRIKEQVFDCFFNLNAGIDWINPPRTKQGREELISQIKTIITNTNNVSAVNDINYEYNYATGELSVAVNYKTIFSDDNVGQFLFS
tara:strand:- start:4273 stop:4629 length:357 start_codon:yes stop_codon:yes gene_type:complete